MNIKVGFAALGLGTLAMSLGASRSMVLAQTTPRSAQTIPEKVPTSSQKLKQQQAPTSLQDGRSDSLSTKLNKSSGVITPKTDVDPGIKVQAPVTNPNSTPVVPPSATGGDTAK